MGLKRLWVCDRCERERKEEHEKEVGWLRLSQDYKIIGPKQLMLCNNCRRSFASWLGVPDENPD